VDFAPTEEHELLRSAVREIARSFGHDYYVAQARNGEKTDELWDAIAAQGFLGVHVPEEHGGGGAGLVELAIVTEEVAAAGCPLLLIVVSAAICAALIARFGDPAQRDAWLPGLVAGEKMAFAITEPDAGSNSHNLSTRATRDGEVFRLRGTKTFISGVDEAPRMLVVTRTGTNESTGKGKLSLQGRNKAARGQALGDLRTEAHARGSLLFKGDLRRGVSLPLVALQGGSS